MVSGPGQLPTEFRTTLYPDERGNVAASPVVVRMDGQTVSVDLIGEESPTTLIAPIHSYAGVMVEINATGAPGAVVARLVLKHTDPQLSVVIAETCQPEQLATSWPSWASALSLPMLVCDTGGSVKPIEAYSVRPGGVPHPRRKLALLTGRRPRFLVRRRCGGSPEDRPVIRGEREIIARS